jgi:hypothetical protein
MSGQNSRKVLVRASRPTAYPNLLASAPTRGRRIHRFLYMRVILAPVASHDGKEVTQWV